jgi:hypothetical protein
MVCRGICQLADCVGIQYASWREGIPTKNLASVVEFRYEDESAYMQYVHLSSMMILKKLGISIGISKNEVWV